MLSDDAAISARTGVHRAASVRLGTGGQPLTSCLGHALDPDGDLLLAVSDRQVAVFGLLVPSRLAEPIVGVAVATDLAPVAVADRVRRTVTLTGPLVALTRADRTAACRLIRARDTGDDPLVWDPDARVLRLEPTTVTMTTYCLCADCPPGGVEHQIDATDYLAAEPDPLADVEEEWLGHLVADHANELCALAMHTAPWLDRVTLEAWPIALDRYGIQIRVRTAATCQDLRLAFDEPAACACEANRAINDLFAEATTTII